MGVCEIILCIFRSVQEKLKSLRAKIGSKIGWYEIIYVSKEILPTMRHFKMFDSLGLNTKAEIIYFLNFFHL